MMVELPPGDAPERSCEGQGTREWQGGTDRGTKGPAPSGSQRGDRTHDIMMIRSNLRSHFFRFTTGFPLASLAFASALTFPFLPLMRGGRRWPDG